MVVVADASVAIRGDLSGFESDLKRAEGATSASAGRMNLTFSNILKAGALFGLGTSLHQLVQGTIRELGDAAAAFSQLQQTQRTTDEVFGESARVIEDWAERAAAAAGMSKQTVFQSASVMGQTLINMGFDAETAAEKVVLLQQRASEMAVAFGQTPERAILAITAAMRGERDTIEKFGVSIKQVDVNSRVAALGLDTSTAAAKKNSEAMAILDLVMEQTAGQADRFAESTDDVAVQMLIAQAKIENGMLEFGRAVASIQLGAVKTATFAGEELDKFSMHFGDRMGVINQLAEENGVTWDEMQQKIVSAMEESGKSFEEVTDGMSRNAQLARAAIAMEMPKGIAAMQEALQLGGPVIAAEAGKIAGLLPSEIKARDAEIRAAGRENVVQFAAGMIDKQQDPLLAMEALARANEEVLSRSAEISRLLGQLNSAELAAGLADGREGVRAAAQAAAGVIEERLRDLGAWEWGYRTGADFAAGLWYSYPLVEGAARGIASATGRQIGIRSEPEAPDSPLRGITEWGGNIVKTIAEGIYGELGTGSAAAGALAGALVPSLGGMGMAPASFMTLPSPRAIGNTINVNMIDRVEKRSVEDIGYGLKRLDDLGKLPGSRT